MRLPRAIRTVGNRLLGPVPVRVRSGVNRGRRWSLACLGRGFGSGTFERDRLSTLEALVGEGESFWDIGAHRGFVALAASRLVGPAGTVVAVEPSAENLVFLRRHLVWNGVQNVRVVESALSDEEGEAAFGGAGSSIAFRLGHGPDTVAVVTADTLVERTGLPAPTFVKLDVEGSEAAVLQGASGLLTARVALLVSVHSRRLDAECRTLLESRGYTVHASRELRRRLRDPDAPWVGDVDFLAVGADRGVDPGLLQRTPLFAPGNR